MTAERPTNTKEAIPALVRDLYDQVVKQTTEFCSEHLTDEYTPLCQKLVAKLCRKRPSPLLGGRLEIWSCAVIYTIAKVNFLFDPKSKPSISGEWLCEEFGTSRSTISPRVRDIMRWFRISQGDLAFTPASKLEDNSLGWTFEVNGFLVDIRYAPRSVQEIAFRRGQIPYIPADRKGPEGQGG